MTTRPLKSRFAELCNLYKGDLVLIHAIQTDKPVILESRLHSRFTEVKIEGEFFDLSIDDINWLRSYQNDTKIFRVMI